MADSIMELRKLEQYITSILEEGDEISVEDNKQEKTETAATVPALPLELLTLDEPSRDPKSSALIQLPSTIYNANPDSAPHGTPQWKKDLSERKGHRVQLLHVGALELDILAKSRLLLHNATDKAEVCFELIQEKMGLAERMKKEYEQWASVCDYHTLDPDAAMGYGPQDDADAGASGYRQMQNAAKSSPPPNKQQLLRGPSSIIDLETYGLESQSDSGSAPPTPTHLTELSPSLLAAEESDIGDFGMDFSSSTDGDDSDDSDRTIRLTSSRQGDRAQRRFGSPVPSIDDDDAEMSDYESDDSDKTIGPREGGSGSSEEGALAAGYGDGDSEQAGVADAGTEDNGAGASAVAEMGMTATATATAEQNDEAANQTDYDDNDAEQPAIQQSQPEPQPQPTKSLIERGGRKVGVYGEEL